MNAGRAARVALTAAVLSLALLQIILTWDFWSTFGAGSHALTLVFQGIGALLAISEALALVVAGQAADRGEGKRAIVARLLFVPLFAINLAGDIGAIATFSAAAETRRDQQTSGFDANERIATEAGREATRLRALLEAEDLNMPASALRPQADAAASRVSRWEATGAVVPRAVRVEAARLQSVLATATEMERQLVVRERALAANAAVGARPKEAHPQFEALATMLRGVGIGATPEGVRIWLAAGVGFAVKLWLAFGLWAASARATQSLAVLPIDDPQPVHEPDRANGELKPGRTGTLPAPRAGAVQDVLDEIWNET